MLLRILVRCEGKCLPSFTSPVNNVIHCIVQVDEYSNFIPIKGKIVSSNCVYLELLKNQKIQHYYLVVLFQPLNSATFSMLKTLESGRLISKVLR